MEFIAVLILCSLTSGKCEEVAQPVPTQATCQFYEQTARQALINQGVDQTHSIDFECREG